MSDYYTRTTEGDYQVTFRTEDRATYQAVEKFCRQMIGHLKPNESTYEVRPRASWIEKEVNNADDVGADMLQSAKCSACGHWHTTTYMYYFTEDNYCPHCGAKMDEEK